MKSLHFELMRRLFLGFASLRLDPEVSRHCWLCRLSVVLVIGDNSLGQFVSSLSRRLSTAVSRKASRVELIARAYCDRFCCVIRKEPSGQIYSQALKRSVCVCVGGGVEKEAGYTNPHCILLCHVPSKHWLQW